MKSVRIKGDIDLLSKNSLSILISQDGLSYSIYDIDDKKVQALVSMQFEVNKADEIRKFIEDEGLKDAQFENINVVYATRNVTIVPDAIFDENSAENIYALNRKISASVGNNKDDNQRMDVTEAQKYIPGHPAVQTIYGWTSNNMIPYHKVGKRIYFVKSELDAWLSKEQHKSQEDLRKEAEEYVNNRRK